MFVHKKYVLQKSFRIDSEVEKDLNILSELVGRSQNELVNVAIKELLKDNKTYFVEIAILEHFRYQFEDGKDVFEPFEMGGLRVEIEYTDNTLKIRSIIKKRDEVIEDFTKEFESDIDDRIDEYLKELSVHIDHTSIDTQKYEDERTDYREYMKTTRSKIENL